MNEMLDHAPADWTPSERLVVVAIAEQANDVTRRGYPGIELIAHRVGVDVGTVSRTLNRLRKKGTEIRVPMEGLGTAERPVYAVRGHRTVYLIPRLCPLPTHSTKTCVERPDGGPPFQADAEEERADGGPAFTEESPDGGPAKVGERADGGPERADGGPPHPLKSPQQPSPQNTREPAKQKVDWAKLDREEDNRRARLGTIHGPVQTILDSLATTDPDATEDEALAVFRLITRQAVEAGKPIKHSSYFGSIAKSGGFTMHLATVRAQRLVKDHDAKGAAAAAIKDELARLRATEPDCEHGTAAGRAAHPVTGEALCPHCRRGIPAPREEMRQPVNDGSNRVVDAYRAGWEAAGHEPIEIATLVAIAAEASALIAAGKDIVQLTRIAAHAGEIRNTLAHATRKLSEALR